MVIFDSVTTSNQNRRVEFELEINHRKHIIYFQSNSVPFFPTAEACIALVTLAAMKHGEEVLVPAVHIDPLFLSNMEIIQRMIRKWDPKIHQVQIKQINPREKVKLSPGPNRDQNNPTIQERRTALFYSGGVDSSFSLLSNLGTIDDLIFIRGFDLPTTKTDILDRATVKIQATGEKYHKNVIEIETNARIFVAKYMRWKMSHAILFGCIGQMISTQYQKILIASAYTKEEQASGLFTPIIHPFWSSTDLEFVYSDDGATRLQKLDKVVQDDLILNSLRVCTKNIGGKYNCGRCEKCLRTMIELTAIGAMDRCTTFANPLDLRRVSGWYFLERKTIDEARYSLEYLKQRGIEPELQAALQKTIAHPGWLNKVYLKLEKARQHIFPYKRF
jgi:hypothetical protein